VAGLFVVALLISGGVAAGLVGIAANGTATAATATHSVPARVAIPAHNAPDDPAFANGVDSTATFNRFFYHVPNGEERIVYCDATYPHIVIGVGLVIPTLAGHEVSSHAVHHPDGWAFAARSSSPFKRTVDTINVIATCSM
jgi:hypothetical protein